MAVKEKKVELIELFYDLIYVFAISRMTLMVEEPEGGILTVDMFFLYIISSMVIIQAWLYMTTYVNRYATWRWYEYVFLVINMAAAVLMSTTLTVGHVEGGTAFILSMMIMISCVGALYAIQLYVEKQDTAAARHSLGIILVILGIYAVSLCISLAGYKEESLFMNIAAVVLGMMLPLIKHGDYDLKIISLPHLMERLELLTIITFGEGIVGITGFFEVSKLSIASPMVFMILIFMFGSYVAQVHYICNHHQIKKVSAITVSHYFIIIAINMVTVALLYFESDEANHLFTAGLMMVSILVFYLSLHSTSLLNSPEFKSTWKEFALSMLFIAAGAAIVFGFMESPYGFLIGSLVAAGGNLYLFWHKYSSNRCVNVIHTVGS